jgi:cell division protein FtsW
VITLLILWGDDMGTSVLVAAMAFFTMFAGNLKWRYFLIPMIVLPLAVIYIKYFDAMRWGRMTIFMDPEANQRAGGYQLWNSLMALGSGSWHGLGLTNSRLKASYLPEAHTDFIFAIGAEEWGLIFSLGLLALYVTFFVCGVYIAHRAPDRLGRLFAFGMTFLVFFQAMFNLGVVTGCLPTKGLALPFVSYGGTNLITAMLAVGVLVNIGGQMEPRKPRPRTTRAVVCRKRS